MEGDLATAGAADTLRRGWADCEGRRGSVLADGQAAVTAPPCPAVVVEPDHAAISGAQQQERAAVGRCADDVVERQPGAGAVTGDVVATVQPRDRGRRAGGDVGQPDGLDGLRHWSRRPTAGVAGQGGGDDERRREHGNGDCGRHTGADVPTTPDDSCGRHDVPHRGRGCVVVLDPLTQHVAQGVLVACHDSSSGRRVRSAASARLAWDFTVPGEMPRASAISASERSS